MQSPISSSLLPVLAPDRIKSDLRAPATSILPEACLRKRIAATGPGWLEIGLEHCRNDGQLTGSCWRHRGSPGTPSPQISRALSFVDTNRIPLAFPSIPLSLGLLQSTSPDWAPPLSPGKPSQTLKFSHHLGSACSAECKAHYSTPLEIQLRQPSEIPPRFPWPHQTGATAGRTATATATTRPRGTGPDAKFPPILPSHLLCRTKNQIRINALWRAESKRTARIHTSNHPPPTSRTTSTDNHPNPSQRQPRPR